MNKTFIAGGSFYTLYAMRSYLERLVCDHDYEIEFFYKHGTRQEPTGDMVCSECGDRQPRSEIL